MSAISKIVVAGVAVAVLSAAPALADEQKLKNATDQVESGAKTAGEGIKDTAKGIGHTVAEGAKTAGDHIKGAGEAAKPEAKNAWEQFKDSASSFGHSVKNFFTGLGG